MLLHACRYVQTLLCVPKCQRAFQRICCKWLLAIFASPFLHLLLIVDFWMPASAVHIEQMWPYIHIYTHMHTFIDRNEVLVTFIHIFGHFFTVISFISCENILICFVCKILNALVNQNARVGNTSCCGSAALSFTHSLTVAFTSKCVCLQVLFPQELDPSMYVYSFTSFSSFCFFSGFKYYKLMVTFEYI